MALSALLLGLTLAVYGAASLVYFLQLFRPMRPNVAMNLTRTGWVLQTLLLFMRRHGPTFEPTLVDWVLLTTWVAVLFYLLYGLKHGLVVVGAFIQPVVFFFMLPVLWFGNASGSAAVTSQGGWLWVHISSMIAAYGAFSVAFATASSYVMVRRELKLKRRRGLLLERPSLMVLERLTQRMVLFGLPMLTVGIIAGAVWAHAVWGQYWSWTPKETATLVGWLVYVVYLASSRLRARRLDPIMWSLLGFAVAMVNLWGVNMAIGGPHSAHL